MPKAGAMFYGSQTFHAQDLFLMLSEPPEDMGHDPNSGMFVLQWPEVTLHVLPLTAPQREQNLEVFGASGGAGLLARLEIVEVLAIRWEGSDPKNIVDTVLMTLCDVLGGYYVRDGRVLGARGPVPL